MSSSRKFFFSLILILSTVFTRFFNLNWSQTFGFHPDENNMTNAVLSLNHSNLKPNFFAYGQFPLYLTYFTTPSHNFSTVSLTLRFWSAVFSSLSVLFFYFISKKIFNSTKFANIFTLLIIFTPGLIQLAHFGTTESILIFVFALNIFLSFLIYDYPSKNIYLLLSGLVSGIGLATKISAAFFLVPICFSFLFLLLKNPKNFPNLIFKFILFILITLLFSLFFSPYNLIDSSNFISAMKYEVGVANGSIPIFYTRQFFNSLPYLFQFQKIFPYTNGIFIFLFGFIGFYFFLKSWRQSNPYLLITLFSSLIFFLYQGQLFVKWTRFMSPIFFVAPLLTVFFFQNLKNKILIYFLVFISLLPGIYFLKTYFFSDTRIQATEWINQNLPENSSVLSESGNVTSLPLYDSKVTVTDFDFYTLDEDNKQSKLLSQIIQQSDFIFIPSRRVFKNQNNKLFPLSQGYYQSLFSGQLNYHLINTFTKPNSFLLNEEDAEETWSVFDNPTIRIYTNEKP